MSTFFCTNGKYANANGLSIDKANKFPQNNYAV